MSGFSQAAKSSLGRALLVGSAGCRPALQQALDRLGYQTAEAEDPYSAMAELCSRPLAYRALVLSLSGVYREELQVIPAVKRRFSHLEIWLAQTDGKAAALAEATGLGADGILSEEGVHRFAPKKEQKQGAPAAPAPPVGGIKPAEQLPPDPPQEETNTRLSPGMARVEALYMEAPADEPILTADELRALLQDPPTRPAANE